MARTAITIRLSEGTLALLDEMAREKDLPRTSIITLLIREQAARENKAVRAEEPHERDED